MKNSYKAIGKKITNFEKIGKGLEQALDQENIQMGNKYMKMCCHYSSGKCKNMRYYYIPLRKAKIKMTEIIKCAEKS